VKSIIVADLPIKKFYMHFITSFSVSSFKVPFSYQRLPKLLLSVKGFLLTKKLPTYPKWEVLPLNSALTGKLTYRTGLAGSTFFFETNRDYRAYFALCRQ